MWNFIRRLKDRLYRWLVPPYSTLIVEEFLPETLNRCTVYVVQEDGFEEQAAMLCPCGCGRVLQMNLIPDERPCWHLAPRGWNSVLAALGVAAEGLRITFLVSPRPRLRVQ